MVSVFTAGRKVFPQLMGSVHRCSLNTLRKDYVARTSRCDGQETEDLARTFSHKRLKHFTCNVMLTVEFFEE